MEKRKTSFILILAQTISEQIVLLLFSLISGGFGVSKSYGESIKMFEAIPLPVWYGIFIVGIVYIFSKAILTYRKELESYNSRSQSLDKKKVTKISTNEIGGGNAFSTKQVNAPVTQQRDVIDSHDIYNFGVSDIPDKDALKYKIYLEARKLHQEFHSLLHSYGRNKLKQFDVFSDVVKEIWKYLLPQAEWILKDTSIPNLIDEIHTQTTRLKINWNSLTWENDEKNNWIRVEKSNHPDIIAINKRIDDLETELDQLLNSIEVKINQLVELTKN